MKNQKTTKLKISGETIRALDNNQLLAVGGGLGDTAFCPNSALCPPLTQKPQCA